MASKSEYVSVLTPCFNAEKYVHRLLDSILKQTYPDIRMIVIDDGSTDGSADIIKSYIPRFEERGFSLKYVYQDNQGQSVAINNGLKMVDGDYLVWPDADDFYANDTVIEKMVGALRDTDESVSTARVQYNALSGEALEVIDRWGVDDNSRYKTDLFEDYLFNATNSIWVVPGGYMVKMSVLDECIPGREIYTEKGAGQNFQIMLPILFGYKCITIEEYLYNVVDHPDSHSRNIATKDLRRGIYKRTVENTLKRIPMDPRYKKHLLRKYMTRLKPLGVSEQKRGVRTMAFRGIKAVLPYGVVMTYKRRRR